MRRFALLTMISMLAVPAFAMAQDASAPPPPDQLGMQPPPPDAPSGGYSGGHHGEKDAMMQKWQAKFAAANTTHDGHLTLQQAESADMRPIVAHFSVIDTSHRGYLTFNEIMAWRLDETAQRMERRAAQLRAQD